MFFKKTKKMEAMLTAICISSVFIACGGYINGDGVINSPQFEITPYECYWFIEARHEGGTVLLKKDNSRQERSEYFSDFRFSITVSPYN